MRLVTFLFSRGKGALRVGIVLVLGLGFRPSPALAQGTLARLIGTWALQIEPPAPVPVELKRDAKGNIDIVPQEDTAGKRATRGVQYSLVVKPFPATHLTVGSDSMITMAVTAADKQTTTLPFGRILGVARDTLTLQLINPGTNEVQTSHLLIAFNGQTLTMRELGAAPDLGMLELKRVDAKP